MVNILWNQSNQDKLLRCDKEDKKHCVWERRQMNDIDFIEWMCEKAEGFKIGDDKIIYSCSSGQIITPIAIIKEGMTFDLLLQKAIEGVNLNHVVGCKITQADHDIIVRDYITSEVFRIFRIAYSESDYRFDQAKESALKYIYEQETK
jgi:hypothetical protein